MVHISFTEATTLIEQMHKVETVAPQVGMTKAALYAACRQKQFPHVRIGNRIRIPESALRRWVEEQTVKTASPAEARAEATT